MVIHQIKYDQVFGVIQSNETVELVCLSSVIQYELVS